MGVIRAHDHVDGVILRIETEEALREVLIILTSCHVYGCIDPLCAICCVRSAGCCKH